MADVTAADIPKGEALAFGAKETPPPVGLNAEQKRRQDKANELKKLQNEGKSPIDIIKSNLGRSAFGRTDTESLRAYLSGGEGRIDETSGRAEIPTTADNLSKANFERAKQSIDKISKLLTYTQVLKEAARDGKTPQEVYTKPPYSLRDTAWNKNKDEALNALLNDGGILSKFSDEMAGLTPDQQRAYVDAVLATDPELNQKIIGKLGEALKQAQELAPVSKTRERAALDSQKTKSEEDIQKAYDSIFGTLSVDRTSPEGIALEAEIKDLLRTGAPHTEIQNKVYVSLLKNAGINNMRDLRDYDKASLDVMDKQVQIQVRRQMMIDRNAGPDKNKAADLAKLQNQINNLTVELGTSKTRELDTISKLGLTEDETKEALQKSKEIAEDVYGTPDPIDGTTKIGGIGSATERLHTKNADLERVNEEIKTSDATPEAQMEKRKRISEETAIIEDIENIMSASVEEMLLARHAELIILENTRLNKAIEEAQKNGDKWQEEKLKLLKTNMETQWIDMTGKNTVTHKDTIKRHSQQLAQNGEDGAKQVFAESVGYDLDETTAKDALGHELFGFVGPYATLTDSQKEQVDITHKDRLAKFDSLYSSEGEAFKTRLLRSLVTARGLKEKMGIGDFLNNNEWKMLDANFGGIINDAVKNSSEAQKALAAAREKGINIAPNSPLKWVLWALLVGVGAMGVNAASNAAKNIA